jgi:MerR family transcriptional regulator, light-induced transcriptional regulator
MTRNKKALYPIRAASRLTRLSVDTLRAWERRYEAVVPQRRNGIRLYTLADIQRLSMLRQALDQGHIIGQTAKLSDADLKKLVSSPSTGAATEQFSEQQNQPINAIVAALESFSYAAADRELSRLALLMSPRELVHHVALPLMRLVGERWHDQRLRVSQEHMLTQLLTNLLGGMIRVYASERPPSSLLTATLSNDLHGFGVLAAAMLAAGSGLGVLHLGPNLPPEEIAYAAKRSLARVVLVSVTNAQNPAEVSSQLDLISTRILADTELWIGVNPPEAAADLQVKRKQVYILKDFMELEHQLKRIGGRF